MPGFRDKSCLILLCKAIRSGAVEGKWVTMHGRHVFVHEGESLTTAIRDRHAKGGQGMNWIKKPKRLALYLRDGMACTFCGAKAEDGTKLTLDHLVPHSKGGNNEAGNLATVCHRCNSVRGDRDVNSFAHDVATYIDHNIDQQEIMTHLKEVTSRGFDTTRAKTWLAAHPGFREALAAHIPDDIKEQRGEHHARIPAPTQH